MKKQCEHCSKEIQGRSDKRFCSLDCKNKSAAVRRADTRDAVVEVDKWLHRNREILLTLMGNSNKEQFDRALLTRTGFKYEYHTGTYLNKEGKMYRLVYDFAWMEFSDQKILIVRKKTT
ncbi:MAG: hypothetical protein IT269_07405 [Saprospiraceae bacterium]|nr:hypothetical protein [Saprospiraceae bacterium]